MLVTLFNVHTILHEVGHGSNMATSVTRVTDGNVGGLLEISPYWKLV